jgi:hypothetical protein
MRIKINIHNFNWIHFMILRVKLNYVSARGVSENETTRINLPADISQGIFPGYCDCSKRETLET